MCSNISIQWWKDNLLLKLNVCNQIGEGSIENSNLCYTNLDFSLGILALIHTNNKESLKGSTTT